MIDNETRDRLAAGILETIHGMQTDGYFVGARWMGVLPKVRTFSELHDHMDANVGWGEEMDALCAGNNGADFADVSNVVFGAVDKQLRIEAADRDRWRMNAERPAVVRAAHMKLIRSKAAKLARIRAREAAAVAELHHAIRAAFDAGVTVTPISAAAGLKRDLVYDINQQERNN